MALVALAIDMFHDGDRNNYLSETYYADELAAQD